jgi:hypothetical protein
MKLRILVCLLVLFGALGVHAKEADVNLTRLDVVIDAPWRVQVRATGESSIPIMFFFPETKAGWRRIKMRAIRLFETSSPGQVSLYEDTNDGPPVVSDSTISAFSGKGITIVNGFGMTTTNLDIVRDAVPAEDSNSAFAIAEINDENRGWHTILRLPVPRVAVAGGTGEISLMAQVDYSRLEAGSDPERIYTIKRRLYVTLDTLPLPNLPGWWAYDAHLHTLAEFSTDLSYKAIRKAYGGPIQMMKECARAIGLIEDINQFRDYVLNTDHNTFFSDKYYVRYGPTTVGISPDGTHINHPELSSFFRDAQNHTVREGQREFENYMDLFGITFGEEVTLAKSGGLFDFVSGTLGSHLLTYSTRHFMGPFHGGRFLVFRDEPNDNTIDRVLTTMAAEARFPNGFCYAAHPFSPSRVDQNFLDAWNEAQVKTGIHGAYIRSHGPHGRANVQHEAEFVFKGFQTWNEKLTRYYATTTIDQERVYQLLEDPSIEPTYRQGNPNWDSLLDYSLMRFHQAVSDSFHFCSGHRPRHRHIRKFYMAAGTDAHGDFNRNSNVLARGLSSLPVQLLRFMKIFSVSDNAFGKVRTVVDPTSLAEPPASDAARYLAAYAKGQSVLTDGPVLDFRVDSCGHYDGRRGTWHASEVFEDDDGRIGGDGDLDGLRTMLVPDTGRDIMLRYRYATSPTFGGDLAHIELYRDDAGGRARLVKVNRNTGPAHVLAPQGHLDPHSPAGPDGWRQARLLDAMAPVRTLCAVSLGGFTRRISTPPYDFRVYTNPVWIAPVHLTSQAAPSGGSLPPGALKLTMQFPISMNPGLSPVTLTPLSADGNPAGPAFAFQPASGAAAPPGAHGGWSMNPREKVEDSVYTLINQTAIPVPAVGQRYGLAARELVDCNWNALNAVAWRLIWTAQGLVAEPVN